MRLAEVSVTLGEGHTEQQIAYALKQAELGTPVEEVCRKMGISDAAFYNWKKKCMDCVADALFDGRCLCALTVVDNYTRESLAIDVGRSIKGEDVVNTLNRIVAHRKLPATIKIDNGSEFISKVMDK